MNIVIGMNKISTEALQAVQDAGGSIEGTQNSDVALVKLPDDKAEVGHSDSSGAFISLPTAQLRFLRAWKTEDCALDLCQ